MILQDTLLQLSQATGIYTFMHSAWGWPLVESLHFIGLCLLIGTVGVYDLRLIGLAPGLDFRLLHRLIPFGVAGFLLNVITGSMFLSSAPDQYLYNPAVQLKFLFLLCAGCNMVLFYRHVSAAVFTTSALQIAPTRARLHGLISLLLWCLVIVCGRLITYYRPPYHWCLWC